MTLAGRGKDGGIGTAAKSTGNWFSGSGGGGWGGASGVTGTQTGGVIATIFGAGYCSGGDGELRDSNVPAYNGKPGRLRLYYTYPALKCDFSLPANGSGGGGAGQITVGEITVIPNETLVFTIGRGGVSRTVAGKNGDPGLATTITRKSNGEILAQALGGLAGQYSASSAAESQGGGKRSVHIIDNNWLGINYDTTAGAKGSLATAMINKGYGGAGGASMNIKGEILQGGLGGNTAKNGASPATGNYGAGGGGGSGSQSEGDSTFGIGAGGAAGYIYFEYGGSNGGGGTAGEFISKRINIKPSTEMTIHIGRGADNANGGETSVTYEIGGNKTETSKARGGIRGNDGGMTAGAHGAVKLLIDASGNKLNNYTENEADPVNGKAGTDTFGGIGGFMQYLYKSADGTDAAYVKDRDGKFAGPSAGGCGGNITSAMECNAQTGGAHGKQGVFGGGGGGGAVVDGVNGTGARGGDGFVIIEYKSTSI